MDKETKTVAQWKSANKLTGTHAPIELREELVAHFVATGSLKACADKFGYSVDTLRRWQKLDWFGPLVSECIAANKSEIVAKQRAIIGLAYDQLFERMRNGDQVLQQGELHHVPVPAKHLSSIAESTTKANAMMEGVSTPSAVLSLEVLADKLMAITDAARAAEAIAKGVPPA